MHLKPLAVALFACFAAACGRPAPAMPAPAARDPRPKVDAANWATFKAAFLRPEGRVVDTFNGGVSHSEGQGYGMILAEAADDRPTFDLLWTWTRTHLQTRPDDALLSWRWRPDAAADPTAGRVDDPNNATDGDLLVAWALARAHRHWEDPAHADAARALCRDLRAKLLRPSRYGPVLLPGAVGFEKSGDLTVNLSYWVFPAFGELFRLDGDAAWNELWTSGMELLKEARFGPAGLPTDWVLLPADRGAPAPAPDHPPVCGYNAVRIPLYALWDPGGKPPLRTKLDAFKKFWQTPDGPATAPAMLDVTTGQPANTDRAMPGTHALARWLTDDAEPNPVLRAEDGYYSGVLLLLTRVAWAESTAPGR